MYRQNLTLTLILPRDAAILELEAPFQAAIQKQDEAQMKAMASKLRNDIAYVYIRGIGASTLHDFHGILLYFLAPPSALEEMMLPHLAEEEEALNPLIGEHMTEAEYERIVQRIVKSQGLAGNALSLPWIIRVSLEFGTDPHEVVQYIYYDNQQPDPRD